MTGSGGTENADETGTGTIPATRTALPEAVSWLYDQAIDRIFSTPHTVRSAAEGKRLLAGDEGYEAMADQVQRVVVVAVPVVRTFARGARLTRVPWVLIASTAFSIASTLRAGVREVQVIGSLLAYRLEQATGRPAEPALVKRLALELYLSPKEAPAVAVEPLPVRRLVQRWVFRGALGRDTGRAAAKALAAAEDLELRSYTRG